MKKIRILFYTVFLLLCKHYQSQIIIFPFKRNISTNIKEEDFYSYYQYNDIYTPINIGTPPVEMNVQIKMSQYSFCLRNDSIYDYEHSSTYKQNEERFEYNYNKYIPSKESFIFGKENIKIDNFNFMLTKNSKYNYQGLLGLKIHENNNKTKDYNIIAQLKANKLINKEIFFFNYNKEGDDGELIIGDYPHCIDKFKEKYSENQFKSVNIRLFNYDIKFDIDFRSIFFNGEEIETSNLIHIELESGYIIGSQKFEDKSYDFLQAHFRNHICKREIVNVLYYAYICDDVPELDISTFPEVNFYISHIDYNLTLTYEDMFIKKNGKIYFMVVFHKFGGAFWTLDYTFIRRNKLIFDKDKRCIGVYINNNNENNNGDKNQKTSNNQDDKNKIIYIIAIIIASGIIICLVVFILSKFVLNKKKKAPFVLDEDFVYNPVIKP